MKHCTTLKSLKQSFCQVLSASDGRTSLSPLEFVTGIVFCFLSDTKSFGLESLRRFLMAQHQVSISKGAFWERLAGEALKAQMYAVLAQLMKRLASTAIVGESVAKQLGVSGIYLIDSSSVSLWDGIKEKYPGTWTTAAIKWHACVDLLRGQVSWFELSPGCTNDRQCFPPLEHIAGKLLIFDLGYWDYGLLLMIDSAKGYFLSRVKSNSVIRIDSVVSGLSECWVGRKLSEFQPKRKYKDLLELRGYLRCGDHEAVFRLIGFWNPNDKKYHWYITNLAVPALVIYPLYRLRWSLELVFKSAKRSFNLDQRLTSNNENIIESLLLSVIIASFASSVVMRLGVCYLDAQQSLALSYQRAAHIVVQLASDFINYITHSTAGTLQCLLNKIRLFAPELFEKNHRHRTPSLNRVHAMLVT